jgi:ribosomal protein S18 acetylase RimI-like enzyme
MPQELAPQFLDLYDTLETGVPAHHYLGYLNDVPVVTSTLLLAAGVAGIYNVATVPEARGQGAGSIMTLMPLHAARKMGYRAGVLQSSEMGFNVYRRLGFEKLTQVDHFQWQAQSPSE